MPGNNVTSECLQHRMRERTGRAYGEGMLGGVEVFRNSHQRPDDAVTSPLSGIGSLLAERLSYALQIEGVARHAGVGKHTTYRWWKSKPELVL